jgi:hypothetical protein
MNSITNGLGIGISDIAAVIAAVGGSTVTKVIQRES